MRGWVSECVHHCHYAPVGFFPLPDVLAHEPHPGGACWLGWCDDDNAVEIHIYIEEFLYTFAICVIYIAVMEPRM